MGAGGLTYRGDDVRVWFGLVDFEKEKENRYCNETLRRNYVAYNNGSQKFP